MTCIEWNFIKIKQTNRTSKSTTFFEKMKNDTSIEYIPFQHIPGKSCVSPMDYYALIYWKKLFLISNSRRLMDCGTFWNENQFFWKFCEKSSYNEYHDADLFRNKGIRLKMKKKSLHFKHKLKSREIVLKMFKDPLYTHIYIRLH